MPPAGFEFAWIAGLALVALAALHMLIVVGGTWRRYRYEGERLDAERAVFRARIDAARSKAQEAATLTGWNGFRKFEVRRRVDEGGGVCSFYLAPHDGRTVPGFEPGQYLTFRLDLPDRDRPLIRCYSLSDAPGDVYRVSIKRVLPPRDQPDAPPGAASSFFHERVKEGDILDVKAPGGQFVLDPERDTPVVLIGGGVGLTPLLSMVNTLANRNPTRETWLFYGVRHGGEHLFAEHLRRLREHMPNLHCHVCYSAPRPEDRPGVDFDHDGRVSVDLMQRRLPASNYEFYICGPPGMMESVSRDLADWGVPKHHVHFEAFGSATVRSAPVPEATTATMTVTFARTGVTAAWDTGCDSVLDLAEANGVTIDSGCRAGSCGTCLTAIRSGTVTYRTEPGAEPEEGSCLTCVCVPESDLVLDA